MKDVGHRIVPATPGAGHPAHARGAREDAERHGRRVGIGGDAMSLEQRLAAVRAASPRVTVIGDFFIDEWLPGRIARTSPAPVIDLTDRGRSPGGAARAALHLARLGARVRAVGMVGADAEGALLRSVLAEVGVDVAFLRQTPGVRTATKSRVLAGGQLMMRLDDAQLAGWPASAVSVFLADAEDASADADAQLVCDHDLTLTDQVTNALRYGPRPRCRVVDALDPVRWRGLRPDVLALRATEAGRLIGRPLGEGDGLAADVRRHSAEILEATGAHSVLVTLGRSGSLLLRPDLPPHRSAGRSAPERPVPGARQVLLAAVTVALGAGASPQSAVDLGQHAAEVEAPAADTFVGTTDDPAAAPHAEMHAAL